MSLTLGSLLAAPGAEAITFDVGPGVPPEQVAVIEAGLGIARGFLEEHVGGDIPETVRNDITVKIVATGLGDGGFCCTAGASMRDGRLIIRLFFDVAHPQWTPPPQSRPLQFWTLEANYHKTVIHEYTHAWQFSLGGFSSFRTWMIEGAAEYVAYQAMIQRGAMRRSHVMDHMVYAAWFTGELGRPLSELSGVWPGHIGYVALDRFIRSTQQGTRAVRSIHEAVANGATISEAFQAVFEVTLEQFYAELEGWRQEVLAGPWLELVTTKTEFAGGDALEIDLVRSNLGTAVVADVYLGALLPTEAGPSLGCPGGDAVAFVTAGSAIVVTCLSAPAQNFPALVRNMSVRGDSPPISVIKFFSGTWPSGAPAGTYVLFVAYTQPGSLSDGHINPGDVIAIGSEVVTLSP